MKLSICMMVRNEERNLPRCLSSVMAIPGFCDELIVVDTGSEDSTVKIAREYGAIIYFHPWRNDYAWMRNKSISYATGDWILYIDADEELVGASSEYSRLKNELSKEKELNAYSLVMEDIIQGKVSQRFDACRIFRAGSVKFHSIVHNKPEVEGGNIVKHSNSGLIMRHYGYDLPPEEMKKKYTARINLLKERLSINPNDFESYFYLAQTYGVYGKIDEAQKAAEIYIKNRDRIKPFNDAIWPLLTEIYLKKEKESGVRWLLTEARERMPLDIDMAWFYYEYAIWKNDIKMVIDAAENYISCYEQFNSPVAIEQRGTKFTFHYTERKLGIALSTSAINLLKMGMDRLHQIGELSTQTSEDLRMTDLQNFLLKIGINWTHKN